jgi:hypothetical protein
LTLRIGGRTSSATPRQGAKAGNVEVFDAAHEKRRGNQRRNCKVPRARPTTRVVGVSITRTRTPKPCYNLRKRPLPLCFSFLGRSSFLTDRGGGRDGRTITGIMLSAIRLIVDCHPWLGWALILDLVEFSRNCGSRRACTAYHTRRSPSMLFTKMRPNTGTVKHLAHAHDCMISRVFFGQP